ncbi:Arc family DNA-binding protein [Azotobacter beijerinckii]|uniref:Arc-like DNA binding domain-containing protein n=1 Tax=Azotobacter beijerinckii TaxID=170623 RepID=A0A1H9JVH5_9GAMM|nr:Arc family DNA-binding protein [Azotobacter beijerinckii]SEI90593.1 Arc-like DNA binding domain-containing protein [Azotobacter beijerinckii]SEQ90838.1 Arc-like DNA binding domain-containing protein [Azotobacter beijerinckii]SFB60128.1 Arc-like DNA binding domain-containing protein [Azotobacter beijerinckii]SFL38153.1 Arc-like DNA binding domain-containing protein [Azotobacter beijerinckii]
MSHTDTQLNNLRLPEELKVKLMEAAKENNRSAIAEIIVRLEETFTREDIIEAKASRDALLVELGTVLQTSITAAEYLNEVQSALQETQKVLDAKLAVPLPSEETKPNP